MLRMQKRNNKNTLPEDWGGKLLFITMAFFVSCIVIFIIVLGIYVFSEIAKEIAVANGWEVEVGYLIIGLFFAAAAVATVLLTKFVYPLVR
jgi:Ca2+/Na+ antiporter